MKRKQHQVYYIFELSRREMGKLKKLRNIADIVNTVSRMGGIRGIMFAKESIEVNVKGSENESEAIIGRVENYLEEQLL